MLGESLRGVVAQQLMRKSDGHGRVAALEIMVGTPAIGNLIREAKTRGAQVITGIDMFIRQAGLQFKLFTGLEPPIDEMSAVLRRELSPVRIHDGD